MSRTGTTNLHKRKLIRSLRAVSTKTGQPVWSRISELLSAPRRKRITVNISKINRHAYDGEVIIVPGKVLGAGKLEGKRLTVVADSFTQKAYEKLSKAGCRLMLLEDIVSSGDIANELKGSKVKIIR